jgi:hypothetical protein
MAKKHKLYTPFPTKSMVVSTLNISKNRVGEIDKLVDELARHDVGQSAFLKKYLIKKKTRSIKKTGSLIGKNI